MSQQALDLRRSVQVVRRHRKLFWAIVALGLLIGAAYAVLKPPMLTSTALVVLPQASAQNAQSASGASTGPDIATQVVVASSIPVLTGALPHARPTMSIQTLQNNIQVTSVADSILSISATGATAADAEATANAVANSYIAYVTAATSPVGHVSASILESASTATGSKLTTRIVIFGLLGALAGALVGFVLSVAISRNERQRLVERDAIANSHRGTRSRVPPGWPSVRRRVVGEAVRGVRAGSRVRMGAAPDAAAVRGNRHRARQANGGRANWLLAWHCSAVPRLGPGRAGSRPAIGGLRRGSRDTHGAGRRGAAGCGCHSDAAHRMRRGIAVGSRAGKAAAAYRLRRRPPRPAARGVRRCRHGGRQWRSAHA